MFRRWLLCGSVVATALVAAGGAGAADTLCTGALGSVTVVGNVSAGPGCDLTGTTVIGNVKVGQGGSLFIGAAAKISGNVQSKGATFVHIATEGGSVGGNVQISNTTEYTFVDFTSVGGNIDVSNSNAWVWVGRLNVGGNVKLRNNTGSSGGNGIVVVSGSTVRGNVDLSNNTASGSDNNQIGVEFSSSTPEAHYGTGFTGAIGGNVSVQGNTATGGSLTNEVYVVLTKVGGNLDVHRNSASGPPGAVTDTPVEGNTVRNNLSCKGNTPPASVVYGYWGLDNTAAKKTGECASL